MNRLLYSISIVIRILNLFLIDFVNKGQNNRVKKADAN